MLRILTLLLLYREFSQTVPEKFASNTAVQRKIVAAESQKVETITIKRIFDE